MADAEPKRVPVLYGPVASPYMCIDPVYMNIPYSDDPSTRALNKLVDVINSQLADVVLAPGEIVLIDNARAIHGRKPFEPRYDGTDRWMKRINVTRDLRKSRVARASESARVIY